MICLFTFFILTLQDQAFKDFDQEGKKLLLEKKYQEASEKFQEAYRLQPKARNYRVEGTFTDSYMPLYFLAMCEENLDLFKAEEWATKSRVALEEEVLKKDRKALAEYHATIKRIVESAKTLQLERDRKFDSALKQAAKLLSENQFKMARTAYEDLAKEFPDKTEVSSGLQALDYAENNYYQNKVLLLDVYLEGGKISNVESLLSELKSTFPSRDFSPYQSRLDILKKAKAEPKKDTIAQVDPKFKEPPAKVETSIPKQPVIETKKVETQTVQNEALIKAQVRAHLIEVLNLFKRLGDPEVALKKLDNSKMNSLDTYASYHWIRALMLACSAEKSESEQQLQEAKSELRLVLQKGLTPKIEERQYPLFFVNLFSEVKLEHP